MTSRAWSGLLRRLAPRVEAGSRGHPDAAAVPHGLCREAPAPYRGPAYALGVLCPLKPPCPPRGRQQAAGGMAEVGGDGGSPGPCWCCGPCGSQERDRTPPGAAAVHGAREGERPHPSRAPGDPSCTRRPEPLLPRSFCSGGRGVPLHLRRRACHPRGAPSLAALLLSGSWPRRQGAAGEIPFAGRSGTLVEQVFRINRRPAQQCQPLGPGPERGLTGAWA